MRTDKRSLLLCCTHAYNFLSMSLVQTIQEALFGRAVCQLVAAAAAVFNSSATSDVNKTDAFTAATEEWREFFSEGVYSVLLPAFMTSTSRHQLNSSRPELHFLVGGLCPALEFCPDEQLLADDDVGAKNFPEDLFSLLNHLGPLLATETGGGEVQWTAYSLLSR